MMQQKEKKNDKSSKIEQIETYQTSNIKDEETYDNNITPTRFTCIAMPQKQSIRETKKKNKISQ